MTVLFNVTTHKSLVFNRVQSRVYHNKMTVYDIPSHMNQFKAAELQQRQLSLTNNLILAEFIFLAPDLRI